MSFIYKITAKMLGTVYLLDIIKNLMLPKLSLLLCVSILMLADFITGILKSRFHKEQITSEKLRKSVIKFMQYFGSIGLVVVLSNQNKESENFVTVMDWTKDGLTILIIYIECLSIFENLYAMDKKTPFAIYVIQPIYWLLSWAIRKNPFNEAAQEKRTKSNGEEEVSYQKKQEPDTKF